MTTFQAHPAKATPAIAALNHTLLGKAVKGLLASGYTFHVAPGDPGDLDLVALVDGEAVGLPVMTVRLGAIMLSHIATAAADADPQVLADLLIRKQINQ